MISLGLRWMFLPTLLTVVDLCCVRRSSVLQQAAAALQGPKEDVKKE